MSITWWASYHHIASFAVMLALTMFLISLVLVIVIPCILIAALVQLEAYHTVRLPVLILALIWGIISFFLTRFVYEMASISILVDHFTLTVFIAPVVEEGFKSVAIIVMYAFVLVRYPGDAMIYGFAVGSGFGMCENALYVLIEPLMEYLETGTVTPLNLLGVALTRMASTGLIHATIGAVVATAVSATVYYKPLRALRVTVAVMFGAIVAHAVYNLVLWLEDDSLILISGLTTGILCLIALIILLNFIARSEKHQIIDELHYDPAQILTQAVNAAGESVNPLAYIQQQFGRKQANLVLDYLTKQGQIAVYAEQLDDGDHRPTTIRALERAIRVDQARAERIYRRMKPDVQEWLQQMKLINAIPTSRDV